jgi:hypothetical protein
MQRTRAELIEDLSPLDGEDPARRCSTFFSLSRDELLDDAPAEPSRQPGPAAAPARPDHDRRP